MASAKRGADEVIASPNAEDRTWGNVGGALDDEDEQRVLYQALDSFQYVISLVSTVYISR